MTDHDSSDWKVYEDTLPLLQKPEEPNEDRRKRPRHKTFPDWLRPQVKTGIAEKDGRSAELNSSGITDEEPSLVKPEILPAPSGQPPSPPDAERAGNFTSMEENCNW